MGIIGAGDSQLRLLGEVGKVGNVSSNGLGGLSPKANSTSKLENACNDECLPELQRSRADGSGETAMPSVRSDILRNLREEIRFTHEFATSLAPMPQATKNAARPPHTTIQSHLHVKYEDKNGQNEQNQRFLRTCE
jgi:hypothetical protein